VAQKIIRDPIFDYISIDLPEDRWLLDLLETREVQRLRGIHQLGVSSFTYPGAEHSRLCHSLGVVHLMQQVVERLQRTNRSLIDPLTRKVLLGAALLHDVGHGPFSHLLEGNLTNEGHEDWTRKILAGRSTEVGQVLRRHGNMADPIIELLRGPPTRESFWKKSLLSSQLDVDRLDYLRRDSYFLGVQYGRFDWYRIINTLELRPLKGCLYPVWPDKTKYAIEEYIFARFYMYQNVYFHHCTRGFEKLLLAIWARAKMIIKDGAKVDLLPAVRPFMADASPTVAEYLRLAECHVLAQVDLWREAKDPVLKDLSGRFLGRKGFAWIELKGDEIQGYPGVDRLDAALKLLKKGGYKHPRSYLLEDRGVSKIYEAYHPEKGSEELSPITAILLHRPNRQGRDEFEEISRAIPDRIQPVTDRRVSVERYYCPKECREQIERILRGR